MAWPAGTALWRKTENTPVEERRSWMVFTDLAAGRWWRSEDQVRINTIERWEAHGINQTAAEALAAAHGGVIVNRSRANDAGEWRVIEEKTTEGTWAAET